MTSPPAPSADPPADRVVLADPAANGLDAMIAAVLTEVLKQPAKVALLDQMRGTVTLTIPDQSAEVGLRFADGVATVLPSGVPGAMLHLTVPSTVLMAMGSAKQLPLIGLPSPATAGGRDLYLALLTRRMKIGGLRHARLLGQFGTLLRLPAPG